jgi:hypothetical protein
VQPAERRTAEKRRRFVKSSLLAVLSVALMAAACSAGDDSIAPDAHDTGTLVTSWTIGGSREPDVCATYGAAQLRLILYDISGRLNATALASCAAFESRRPLIADSYVGFVTFLDAAGASVSGTIALGQIDVAPGVETRTTFDFPATALRTPLE